MQHTHTAVILEYCTCKNNRTLVLPVVVGVFYSTRYFNYIIDIKNILCHISIL